MISGHRIIASIGELGGGAVQLCGSGDYLVQTPLQEVAHLGCEAARGAAQTRGLRNHVIGRTGLKHADRNYSGAERIDVARNNRLDLIDDLCAHEHAVDGDVRARRVSAAAFDLDRDAVGSSHQRARPQRELADRKAGIVMHAVHFLDAEAVHEAVLNHRLAASAAFFGRLENDDCRAGEVARLG
jgi:hypothetical protein